MSASRVKVLAVVLGRAWRAGAGPGEGPVTIDLDSTICPVSGKTKGGAAFRLHQRVGLSPAVGVPGGYGGGDRRSAAGRVIAEGCGAFRERNSRSYPAGRG